MEEGSERQKRATGPSDGTCDCPILISFYHLIHSIRDENNSRCKMSFDENKENRTLRY